MEDKTLIIKEACSFLLENKRNQSINLVNCNYGFNYIEIQKRNYTEKNKLQIFLRDGFIDRYSGDKLIIPGILKVLSNYFPKDFPYHPHWKMKNTHIAYWELVPTVDHVVPIAFGGENTNENLVTTSMLHNSIKSNWTLEQIGWKVIQQGNLQDWDGLISLFIQLVARDKELLNDEYIKRWYLLVKSNIIIDIKY